MDMPRLSKRFLLGCMYIFLINGAIVLMTSAILADLMQDYRLTYDQGGLLIAIQSIGCLLSNFLSGAAALRFGNKFTLTLAGVCFLVGYAGIALQPSLLLLQILLFVTGLGWGSFNNLVNFLMNQATHGDSGKITMVHTSFSVGAFLAPLLVGQMARHGIGWRWPVAIIAAGSLLLVFVILVMPLHAAARSTRQTKPLNLDFLRQWRYYLYMLLLFTYCGTEISCSSWLVTYLTAVRHYDAINAQTMLSVLWVAIIAGRILVSILGSRLKKAAFLLLEGIGTLAGALLLAGSSQPLTLTLAVVLIGFSLSAFYGMVIANATGLIFESSLASGLMMSLGGLGSTVVPYLIGAVAASSGITSGIWCLAGLAGLLMLQTLVNYLTRTRD